MHPEIEKLIDLAIADGQITEKERNVILKKAAELGVDADEVEMTLDGKLHQLEANKPKQKEKVGNIKTCPSCGAVVIAFSTSCSECNLEFGNVGVNKSVKLLSEKLENIILECNKMTFEETNLLQKLHDTKDKQQQRRDAEISSRQRDAIKNFPIPNSKEDILEMLHFILPKTKSGFSSDKHYSAWVSKFEEIISRSKAAFANDSRMMSEILFFEKEQKSSTFFRFLSRYNELTYQQKMTFFYVIIIIFLLIFISFDK